MRMRRKKHLDERLADCAERYINLQVADTRFDATGEEHLLDLAALFGNDNPVELEIGCGKGGFICELAARNPDVNYLALEKYNNVLVSACEAAQARGLDNVCFLWGGCGVSAPFSAVPQHTAAVSQFLHPVPEKKAQHPPPDSQPLSRYLPKAVAGGRRGGAKNR